MLRLNSRRPSKSLTIPPMKRMCSSDCFDHCLHMDLPHIEDLLSPNVEPIGVVEGTPSIDLQLDARFCTKLQRQQSPGSFTPPSAIQTILLTGGAGFIGSHTAKALLKEGHEVILVDEMNDYYDIKLKEANLEYLQQIAEKDKLHIYKLSVENHAAMEALYRKHHFTQIIHLAARAGVRPSIDNPYIYIQSNVLGTLTLLELCRFHPRINHFVYASSSSVYGNDSESPFTEKDRCDQPVSVYAASKRMCELLATSYAHLFPHIQCSGLRFFTVYGPNCRVDMAPYMFIDRIYRDQTIHQFGDGQSARDYTYIDDIVDGILGCAKKPNGHVVYNLGRGEPLKLSEFIKTIEQLLNKKATIEVLDMQQGDVLMTCANITLAKETFGYAPKVSVQEGLKKTVEWYLAHRAPTLNFPSTKDEKGKQEDGSCTQIEKLNSIQYMNESPNIRLNPVVPFADLVTCTRIYSHQADETKFPPDLRLKLIKWATLSLTFSHYVAIATTPNLYDDCIALFNSITEFRECQSRIAVLSVSPWNQITPALNALLLHSRTLTDCRFILYSSVEIECQSHHITRLYEYIKNYSNCLVVGARLEGMDFRADCEHRDDHETVVEINGITVPWNTVAIWNRDKLARTGFLTISDGIEMKTDHDETISVPNGMEEVCCISLHQQLYGEENAEAVVIDVNNTIENFNDQLKWEIDWSSPTRHDKHIKKMQSKLNRAQIQMQAMNLKPGKVRHIK